MLLDLRFLWEAAAQAKAAQGHGRWWHEHRPEPPAVYQALNEWAPVAEYLPVGAPVVITAQHWLVLYVSGVLDEQQFAAVLKSAQLAKPERS